MEVPSEDEAPATEATEQPEAEAAVETPEATEGEPDASVGTDSATPDDQGSVQVPPAVGTSTPRRRTRRADRDRQAWTRCRTPRTRDVAATIASLRTLERFERRADGHRRRGRSVPRTRRGDARRSMGAAAHDAAALSAAVLGAAALGVNAPHRACPSGRELRFWRCRSSSLSIAAPSTTRPYRSLRYSLHLSSRTQSGTSLHEALLGSVGTVPRGGTSRTELRRGSAHGDPGSSPG